MPWRGRVVDRAFVITLSIDTGTGDVSEVIHGFSGSSPYARVPPGFYRELELAIKENLHFTLTEAGKKLNYSMLSWAFGVTRWWPRE